jgi:AcrR family transcriptional regulator
MARRADVAAGTFYLYFRDKRAAYEKLARRAAHDLLEQWRGAVRSSMGIAERVALGLALAADFWRADLDRARLLLEGGPAFGSENHVRFVDEIAAAFASMPPRTRRSVPARALALIVAGLALELGRLIVGRAGANGDVEELVRLVRRSLGHLDRKGQVPGRALHVRGTERSSP